MALRRYRTSSKFRSVKSKESYGVGTVTHQKLTEWDISITPLLKGKGDVLKRFKSTIGDLEQLAKDEFGEDIAAINMRTPIQVDVRLKSGVRYVIRKVNVRI